MTYWQNTWTGCNWNLILWEYNNSDENITDVCIEQYSCYRLDLNEDMVDYSTGTLTQQYNAHGCMLMVVYKSIHMKLLFILWHLQATFMKLTISLQWLSSDSHIISWQLKFTLLLTFTNTYFLFSYQKNNLLMIFFYVVPTIFYSCL
jgi:hypothetical protein